MNAKLTWTNDEVGDLIIEIANELDRNGEYIAYERYKEHWLRKQGN